MHSPVSPPPTSSSNDTRDPNRTKALVAMVMTVGIAIAAWIGISTAADRGIARLATIEAERTRCQALWSTAQSFADTVRVDRSALRDTIDASSATAMTNCGSLRDRTGAATPNPREMSGEPMPQGLR